MIKTVIIDSNNTIENYPILKNNREIIFDRMTEYINKNYIACKTEEVYGHLSYLEKFNSTTIWENHPFFWRSLLITKKLKIVTNKIIDDVYDKYIEQYAYYIEIFEDALFLLRKLKYDGYNIVLLANGNDKRLRVFLDKFNLHKFFNEIMISGEMPYKKPDEFVYQYVIKRFNNKANQLVMIGDKHVNDIWGAKKNGINTILINRSKSISFSDGPWCIPDFSVDSLYEAYSIIKYFDVNLVQFSPINFKFNNFKKIKTALVLAGGRGSRLGKIGVDIQKTMLEINKKPILEYVIEALKNAGVERVILSVNYKSSQIINYFGNGEKYGLDIKYIEKKYDFTSDITFYALRFLDKDFYYCHGNILFRERLLEKLWELYQQNRKSVLALIENAAEIKHQIIKIDKNNNIISSSSENKNFENSRLTFLGVGLYSKDIYSKYFKDHSMTESFLENVIKDKIRLKGYVYRDNWFHLESPEDIKKAKGKSFWELKK